MAEFYTVVTDAGREAVARAMQAGEKVDITHFAVGDGGGVPVQPSKSQTQLVNECWRGLVATYKQEGTNIIIDTYIPSDEASFTAREMGVFTSDGVLFAVCNTPEMRKVLPSEGAVGDFAFGMKIDVSNLDTSYIEIHTNPQLDFIKNSEKGQPNGVATLDEHGNVEQLPEMDFYTKEETLANDTKNLFFGLSEDAVPDTVFRLLYLQIHNRAMAEVTVLVDGQPAIAGILVNGLKNINGEPIYTDENGIAVGFIDANAKTVSTLNYQDLATKSASISPVQGQTAKATINLSAPQEGSKILYSSTNGIYFSPYVDTVDVSMIGGGGGGGVMSVSGSAYNSGDGGEQGKIATKLGIKPDSKVSYSAVIGAGGIGGREEGSGYSKRAGTKGGTSSFMGVQAEGGQGDTGGGEGGFYENGGQRAASSGNNGEYLFEDSSKGIKVGGDGGGGGNIDSYPNGAKGGEPYGGDGGTDIDVGDPFGKDGTYGGGGGGGAWTGTNFYGERTTGGDGGDGVIQYYWYLKEVA